MKLRIFTAAVIFIGSYLPLSLILLALNIEYIHLDKLIYCRIWTDGDTCHLPLKNPGFAIGIFVTCLICFILTLFTLAVVKPKHEIIVSEAEHTPSELMSYVLPYIVSFMSIDYQETGKFVGLAIFLAWMFWITFKSGQIILNPLLSVFGWRLYKIRYSFVGNDRNHHAMVFSKIPLMVGNRYRQVTIQDVMLVKKDGPNEN